MVVGYVLGLEPGSKCFTSPAGLNSFVAIHQHQTDTLFMILCFSFFRHFGPWREKQKGTIETFTPEEMNCSIVPLSDRS
jgi:hypothetical protein